MSDAAKLYQKPKLLDSEGNLISPAVIREADLIRRPLAFIPTLFESLDSSNSTRAIDIIPPTRGHNHNETGDVASHSVSRKDGSKINHRENSNKGTTQVRAATSLVLGDGHFGRPGGFQQQEAGERNTNEEVDGTRPAEPQCRSRDNFWPGVGANEHGRNNMTLQTDLSHQTNTSNTSALNLPTKTDRQNHAAGRNSTTSQDIAGQRLAAGTFGSGWWEVKGSRSSQAEEAENSNSAVVKNVQIDSDITNIERAHSENIYHNTESRPSNNIHKVSNIPISDHRQDRQRPRPDTFGSGWWRGKLFGHSETGTQTLLTDKLNNGPKSKLKNADKNDGISDDQSGARSISRGSKSESLTSDHHQNINCASSGDRTSSRNKVVKKQTQEQNDSDSFGVGWWKHRATPKTRDSKNSSKAKSDDANRRQDFSVKETESLHGVKDAAVKSRCVVPYTISVTPELILRFVRVASYVASGLIQEEAVHGRTVAMSLLAVPGLWKACLGGSRVSLLAEIVHKWIAEVPGVIVQDKFGHHATVLFNTTDTARYQIPECRGLLSLAMSECLTPGTFVLLRAVKWYLMSSEEPVIVMLDMNLVDFIFYEFLA